MAGERRQPERIRRGRKRVTGQDRESEGLIVPFEAAGQHNLRPREGALLCSCNQSVEDGEIAVLLTTPDKIRTLQRTLYLKAKQEPAFRFYALYDKVCRADFLGHAYDLVAANKGAPGCDGVTFEAIEAAEGGKAALVDELRKQLVERTYRASPVRRVWIPKANGDKRPLGIPTIRDRVVQMAAKLVIEPIFEADFCETSHGFRPKRSADDAIDAIADALVTGHVQVIDADLSKYFDTIPHDKLMATVATRIVDGAVLALIKQWLVAPVVEEDEDGTRRMAWWQRQSAGYPARRCHLAAALQHLSASAGPHLAASRSGAAASGEDRSLCGRLRRAVPSRHRTADGPWFATSSTGSV